MKKIKTNFLLCASMLYGIGVNGQSAIQQLTVTDNGSADTLGVVRIIRNSNNALIITGNKSINATQCNFQTICLDPQGNQTWSQLFNSNLQKAYTTAATHDSNDNIIVVGCTYINGTNLQDLTVLKYSPSGSLLWQAYYNGGANDVASDVTVDSNNNIYVTGSQGGAGLDPSNYVTLKLSPTGTILWTTTYNYNGFIDVPMKINYNSSTGYVTVSGTSGSNMLNFDIATVQYDASSGSQQSVYRQSSSTAAQNLQSDLAVDNNGNIYYTGRMWNGNNYDILLSKFDHHMNAIWSISYDGFGLDDGGSKIAWDSNSNSIIVAGYVTKPGATEHEMMILKYNTSGVLQYKYPEDANRLPGSSEAIGLRLYNGNIYVGGNSTVNNNKNAFLLKLNGSFLSQFYQEFNNSASNEDQFFDLNIDNGNILLTTRSVVSGQYRNLLVHYAERDVTPIWVGSQPSYIANQQIVKFNPNILKMSKINDTKFIFGQLSDFIEDSVCDRISAKLSSERQRFNAKAFNARKIFRDMTEKDSLSTTRLGDVIKVPKFYSAILVDFPTLNVPLTLQGVSDTLNKLQPSIFYSEFNIGLKKCSAQLPNDFNYYNQPNLHHWGNLPFADINVDTSWAVAHGDPAIRVGIFDTGVQNSHIDLSGAGAIGVDFVNNGPGLDNDGEGHGTMMAGIIAATKNNGYGIAGIAGRDDSLNTAGVTLAGARIVGWDSQGYDSLAPEAILALAMHHAMRGDSTGFAINVANHPWAYQITQTADTTYLNRTLQDQILFACRNGVAQAASKFDGGHGIKAQAFPADWNPEIMTCVGGSGTDGERAVVSPTINPPNTNLSVQCGYHMDFVAPAAQDLNYSTYPGIPYPNTNIVDTYDQPYGGSAATSHVSGAYALMMSYFNTVFDPWGHLLHEDCENILKRTCTDLSSASYTETVGYDQYSGYGRINVSRAIREINKFHYRFRHINNTHTTPNYAIGYTLINTANIQWPAYNGGAAGTYPTDVYEVGTTLNYTLTPTETIIDKWPMYKECFGASPDVSHRVLIEKPYYAEIVSATNTQASLKTYAYYNQTTHQWFPANGTSNLDVRSAITLYTYDTNHTGVGIQENVQPNTNFRIRPNPNNGMFNITFGSEEETDLQYKLFDLLGREIKSNSYRSTYGVNNIPVDVNELSNGIYLLNVIDGHKVIYNQKVIKN